MEKMILYIDLAMLYISIYKICCCLTWISIFTKKFVVLHGYRYLQQQIFLTWILIFTTTKISYMDIDWLINICSVDIHSLSRTASRSVNILGVSKGKPRKQTLNYSESTVEAPIKERRAAGGLWQLCHQVGLSLAEQSCSLVEYGNVNCAMFFPV